MKVGKSGELSRILRTPAGPYRILFEHMPVAICWVGLDGRILRCNPTMLRLTGYSEAEICGMNAMELLHDAAELQRLFDGVVQDKPDGHTEALLVRKDDTCIPVRAMFSRVTLCGRDAILMAAVDIMLPIEAQTRLETVAHTLEEKEQALRLKSIALGEVVEQIEAFKKAFRENIAANIRDSVLPIVEKLRLNEAPADLIDLLERALQDINDRFGIRIAQIAPNLSSRESEISRMIHCGLSSKQIARLLGISQETVEKHRRNIRRKVGITGRKVNLAAFLNSGMQETRS